MIEKADLNQLQSRGISVEIVEKQIQHFRQGFPYSDIQYAAELGDGIIALNSKEEAKYVDHFEKSITKGTAIAKFVPASGAATRMFKELFSFLSSTDDEQIRLSEKEPYKTFFNHLSKFPFFDELMHRLPKEEKSNHAQIVNYLLNPIGLGYGSKPKGILSFHAYGQAVRTAAMEHLFEGLQYARGNNNLVEIHFTVSPEHQILFESTLTKFTNQLENDFKVRFNITYSCQKPSTDTIAVDMANNPIKNETGELIFRPAGHGALIENLNELDQDVIFIKNIDNVMTDNLLPTTVHYKKVLSGFALSIQNEIFDLLKNLDRGTTNAIEQAATFLTASLKHIFPKHYHTMSHQEKIEYMHHQLNRPIRVCGMVKNEGEPGGGPFWVKNSSGNCTLQIVEMAQIDLQNPQKKEIVSRSTHFNPVDLVCCTKDYKGNKFNLTNFVDHQTGFISEKSINGRPLKALELPGLWNGAMAGWLTYFIEVPAETFNPVKTVMDLLRPSHQPVI